MDEVLVVGVGEFLRGVVGEFGDNEGREVGWVGGVGGGVFGENGAAVCYAGAGGWEVSWARVGGRGVGLLEEGGGGGGG